MDCFLIHYTEQITFCLWKVNQDSAHCTVISVYLIMTILAAVKFCSNHKTNSYRLVALLLSTKSNMRKHTKHEAAICHTPSMHNFKGDRKNLTDAQQTILSMLGFHDNIMTSNFLWSQHFDRTCICYPTVSNTGISVWRTVLVMTNCHFMSNMLIFIYIL